MKKYILIQVLSACFAALLAGCSGMGAGVKIKVTNTERFARETELAEVPVDQLPASLRPAEGEAYEIRDEIGNIIPSQVTHDGVLVFPCGLGGRESATFGVSIQPKREYSAKTYGRFIKERKDDFAWENDRVAFRIYGPALQPVDGPSNGIDFWYKRTERLVIDRWYAADIAGRATYHRDNGEGLDDYKVGRTLGGGAMAPFVGGRLWLNGNFASYEVLDNGPLRTTFRVTYPNLEVVNNSYTESRTFSIDAGSNFTRVVQEYGFTEPTVVVAGFPLHAPDTEPVVATGDDWMVLAEPATRLSDGVWLGLVFPDGLGQTLTHEYDIPDGKQRGHYEHILAMRTYEPGRPITYYTGYGWAKAGFATMEDFQEYTGNFAAAVNNPLVVAVKGRN